MVNFDVTKFSNNSNKLLGGVLPIATCMDNSNPFGFLELTSQWSRQEAPTCCAIGAHSTDREEDIRICISVSMKHLQRGPAMYLGEAGVPIQRPKEREYSCMTGPPDTLQHLGSSSLKA